MEGTSVLPTSHKLMGGKGGVWFKPNGSMKTIEQLKHEAKIKDKVRRESERGNLFEIRSGRIVKKSSGKYKPKRKKRIKHHKKKRANRLAYSDYIKSNAWRDRKNKYFQTHKRQCNACYSTLFVQVHHMVYRKKLFGIEPDEHLMVLCSPCHIEYHQKNGTQQNMLQKTLDFVRDKRNPPPSLDWIV